jgi:hypothetical protein
MARSNEGGGGGEMTEEERAESIRIADAARKAYVPGKPGLPGWVPVAIGVGSILALAVAFYFLAK